MEERRKVRVQTRDGREDGAQMSYGLMIETNFDNCFGPLHCVCRTKLFRRGREKACLSDQLCLLRQGPLYTNWNTLILYSGRY